MKSNFISKKEVARMLNISPSTVTRWSKTHSNFPEPFPLGPNKVVWDVREIENYVNEQKKHRGFLGHKTRKTGTRCQQNSMKINLLLFT